MNFDIHDAYQRAPFGLIPPSIIKDIKTRLLFDDSVVRQIMHSIMGWNYGEINLFEKTGDRDPLQKMFDTMTRYEPECVITCADIDNHFRFKKCFPIIKVYSILKPLTPVYGFLEKEETINLVVKEIQERRSNQTLYPNAREFKKDTTTNTQFLDYAIKPTRFQWVKDLISKKSTVLVVNFMSTDTSFSLTNQMDPVIQISSARSINNEYKENFPKLALKNLVGNLSRNFTCIVTPDAAAAEWNDFIDNQFKKASFTVVVFSRPCLEVMDGDSLNSSLPLLNGYHSYLWDKVIHSNLPTVGVVFEKEHQAEAEKYMIPIFLLPIEMEYLLDFIIAF